MYKMVIVDDEMLVRIGIKTIIPWEEHGFVVAGEASDGKQAIELCKKILPDIVLADIKMPHMDGLEFFREARKLIPDLKVVILSCYDDFSYVREALKLGASDYILKPTMSPKYLLEVMYNLRKQIDEEKSAISEVSSLRTQVEKSRNLLKDDLLRDLIFNNNFSDSEAEIKLKEFNLSLSRQNLYIHILKVDNLAVLKNYNTEYDKSILFLSISNIISEILVNYPNVETLSNESREFIFIVSFTREVCEEKIHSQINSFCSKLHSLIIKYLNVTVSIGVSRMHTGFANLEKAYLEAEHAMENRFYTGSGRTNFYEENFVIEKSINITTMIESLPIQKAIETGNPNLLNADIDKIFSTLKACSIGKARQMCIHLLFHISREYSLLFLDTQKIVDKYDSYGMILQLDTLDSIIELMHKVIRDFTKQSGQICDCSSIVNKARLFVKQYYSEDISLKRISDYLNISKNYFCQLFKNETGENFISYLNRFRVEKAKELIIKEDFKTYEIAEKVGIPNARHFSNLFKIITGQLPTEYRRKYSGIMSGVIQENSLHA